MRRTFLGLTAAAVALAAGAAARAGVGFGTIEDSPEMVHARMMQKAEDDYKAGLRAKAAGDASTAVRCFLRVATVEGRIDSPYPSKAFEELKVYHEQARQDLLVAREFLAGEDPGAGLLELKRITRTYMGLGPAKEAGALALQLEGDPQFQARLRVGRLKEDLKRARGLEAEAQALLADAAPPTPGPPSPAGPATPALGPTPTGPGPTATAPGPTPTAPGPTPAGSSLGAVTVTVRPPTEEARRALRLTRLLEAYDLYGRVAEQGADTEPGKAAAEARARLEQDAGLLARLQEVQAEREARQWMGLAENYHKAGRFDLARQYCRKVLAEHPRSAVAPTARALLGAMK